MKNVVLSCFERALEDYTKQSSRGYSLGLFSHFRHQASQYSALIALENLIKSSTDENIIDNILHQHLLKDGATFNAHSFNSYFIDELSAASATNYRSWSMLLDKPVEYYQGMVFRGTSLSPETAFRDGMQPRDNSDKIENYLEYANGSIGTSTSKRFSLALEYALSSKRREEKRYIYVIDYSQNNGYDIEFSADLRGISSRLKNHYKVSEKAEVNIKGGIEAEDIVGAYEVDINLSNEEQRWNFIENPNYRNFVEAEENLEEEMAHEETKGSDEPQNLSTQASFKYSVF